MSFTFRGSRPILYSLNFGLVHFQTVLGQDEAKVIDGVFVEMTFKNAIHSPKMAFTLISISRLDKAGYQVNFKKGMCTIMNPKGQIIATIPHSDVLYRIIATKPPKD